MHNVLFICNRNRWRSPTAEEVFAGHPGIDCSSAELSPDADHPLTPELVQWADTIFVMEREHKDRLSSRFKPFLAGKRVVCLDIADLITLGGGCSSMEALLICDSTHPPPGVDTPVQWVSPSIPGLCSLNRHCWSPRVWIQLEDVPSWLLRGQ